MHFPVTLRVCLSQPPCFLIANVRIFFSTKNKIAQCLSSVLFEKGRYCTWGRHELSVNAVCALGNFFGKFSKADHSLWNHIQITGCFGRNGLYGTYGTLSLMYVRFTAWILLYYWDLTLILWWWEGAILLLWNSRSLLLLFLHLLGGWEQVMLSCHLLPLQRGKQQEKSLFEVITRMCFAWLFVPDTVLSCLLSCCTQIARQVANTKIWYSPLPHGVPERNAMPRSGFVQVALVIVFLANLKLCRLPERAVKSAISA